MDIISKTNTPTKVMGGTKSRSHQAERFMSCNRRTCTDSDGKSSTNLKIHPITGMKLRPKLSSVNHQYSDRDARPLKLMYFWKHVLIASVKLTS